MRKLLRNKTVVTCLAVTALLCVVANFLPSSRPGAPIPVAARTPVEPAAFTLDHYPVAVSLRVARALEQWRTWPPAPPTSRDPFQPVHVRSIVSTNPAVASSVPRFVVQAISVAADKTFAVINRQIVTRGDRIEGYVVEEILPAEVRLQGPAGRLDLTVRPASRAGQKQSTGK